MPFVRLMIPVGLLVFGAVALFMGAVVSVTALRNGSIAVSYRTSSGPMVHSARRETDPAEYWRLLGLAGGLPLLLGGLSIWSGRRMLRG